MDENPEAVISPSDDGHYVLQKTFDKEAEASLEYSIGVWTKWL